MIESSMYEKHLQFMQSVYSIDDISESSLIAQFDLLLSCLPNGGKLYKYRSLCGKSFSYAYDGLANGYMWIASVKTLNDDFDSVMISDAESEGKRFIDYIMQDYDKTLYTLVKQRGQQYWDNDEQLKQTSFESFLKVFDPVSGKMDDGILIQVLRSSEHVTEQLNALRKMLKCLTDDLHLFIDQHLKELFNANIVSQERFRVFSMSESYDLGNMWGYYADSGRGFCIEYDYNRVKDLGPTAMRYLLNTYKVIYSETPKEISPEFLAEAFFFSPDDSSLKEQLERFILEKVLCKDKYWENEKEWRIVLGNTDCKMPVDIVSAIIIDERSLQKTNAQKLIRLCKKRGWQVKVRKNHLFNTSHSYDAYV